MCSSQTDAAPFKMEFNRVSNCTKREKLSTKLNSFTPCAVFILYIRH